MSRQPCRTHALPLARRSLHRQPDPPRHGRNHVCVTILNSCDPGPKPRHHRCDHQRRYPGDRAVFPSRPFDQPLKRDTQGGGDATSDFPWWISHSPVPLNTRTLYQHITTPDHDSRITRITTPRLLRSTLKCNTKTGTPIDPFTRPKPPHPSSVSIKKKGPTA